MNMGTIMMDGNVKISTLYKGKKIEGSEKIIHNNVTTKLFQGVGAFLQGFVTNSQGYSDFIPKYLGISTSKQELNPTLTKLDGELNQPRMQLTPTTSYISGNTLHIPFQTIIPYESAIGVSIQSLGLFGRENQLANNEDQYLLAAINLNENISIDIGYSLQITWEFIISNPTINTTTGDNK